MLAALLALAAVQPQEFLREETSPRLQFSYEWPAAADAVPALRTMLRRDMEAARASAIDHAEEGAREAAEDGREPMQHYYVKGWRVAGHAPGLLSLQASTETFAGGAHGNVGFSGLLWDLAVQAPVEASALLGARALERLTPRFCRALDAEREQIRGEPVRADPDDPFTLCPPLAEQVLVPEDEDGNGRFERLHVLIPPYVAGPYADGPYTLPLAFEAGDLAGIDPRYRAAFEAARDRVAD